MKGIEELIEISRFYGGDSAYVIAGGGNTSYKNHKHIWIKASGIPLAGIDVNGFVCLSREKLRQIEKKAYSGDPVAREEEVKADISKAIVTPGKLRPSVETSLHNLIDYKHVVHTHPTLVNGLLCSNHVKEELDARFGEMALYVEYTDPGFILFKKLQKRIAAYREKQGKTPQIIFLQNHGVFVGADTTQEIRKLYRFIDRQITNGKELSLPSCKAQDYESVIATAVHNYFHSRELVSRSIRCDLVDHFTRSVEQYLKVSQPFSPDIIVYCKSTSLFIGKDADAEVVVSACMQFEETHGYYPKVIMEEQGGLIGVEESAASLDTVIQVFTDEMKVSYLSESFGGPHFMTAGQIRFIDNWEVEHYRRKVAKGSA
ncbi:MAG: class II aldolase/adducin family protein [Bacteroidota bacterium]